MITAYGAIVGLCIAIILILRKINPTYAMIIGAVVGGLVGGAGLTNTVKFMIVGTQGIVSAIIRIITAGILEGTLIESGAAKRIADSIIASVGTKRSLIAMMLATWILTAVGVFGDVAIITVAPVAILMAKQSGYRKLGVLMAMIGGVKAGNVMSPNPNAIAASEGFNVPLTSVMAIGIIPAITALIATGFIAYYLRNKGTDFENVEMSAGVDEELPTLAASISGPLVTIALLLLRPLLGVTVDPLIALPLGGIAGMLAMRKAKYIGHYFDVGIAKMSGVAMLLIGTGTLAGIISNSALKDVITAAIESVGLPGFMLAPIAGTLMGAATASSTAGTTLGSQIFGPTVVAGGTSALAAAAMTHCGSFVFDGLPHGSFFHVSAGTIGMKISERLKLIFWESLNGVAMVLVSVFFVGILKIAG